MLNNVSLTGEITRGKTWRKALIDMQNGKKGFKNESMLKFWFQNLKDPQNNQFRQYR